MRELDPERRAWLEQAMQEFMKDFAERMREIKDALTGSAAQQQGGTTDEGAGGSQLHGGTGATAALSLAEKEALCDELLDIVESVDHARGAQSKCLATASSSRRCTALHCQLQPCFHACLHACKPAVVPRQEVHALIWCLFTHNVHARQALDMPLKTMPLLGCVGPPSTCTTLGDPHSPHHTDCAKNKCSPPLAMGLSQTCTRSVACQLCSS